MLSAVRRIVPVVTRTALSTTTTRSLTATRQYSGPAVYSFVSGTREELIERHKLNSQVGVRQQTYRSLLDCRVLKSFEPFKVTDLRFHLYDIMDFLDVGQNRERRLWLMTDRGYEAVKNNKDAEADFALVAKRAKELLGTDRVRVALVEDIKQVEGKESYVVLLYTEHTDVEHLFHVSLPRRDWSKEAPEWVKHLRSEDHHH